MFYTVILLIGGYLNKIVFSWKIGIIYGMEDINI